MGAGNKMDPTKFQVADISKTTVCPLARVIRNELKTTYKKSQSCFFYRNTIKTTKNRRTKL